MSTDLRDQLRELGELQRSSRRPVELHDLGVVIDTSQVPYPERRHHRGLMAIVAAALLVLVGGLVVLFTSNDEPSPADNPASTTVPEVVVPPATVPSVSTTVPVEDAAPERFVTASEGPLGLTVEWTKLDASQASAFADYGRRSNLVARIDGEWAVQLFDAGPAAEPGQWAFSGNGLDWEVRPLFPDDPELMIDRLFAWVGGDGILRVHRLLESVLPLDIAWYDGDEWHRVSIDATSLLGEELERGITEFTVMGGGQFYEGCASPDGTIRFWYEIRDFNSEILSAGWMLVGPDETSRLADPPRDADTDWVHLFCLDGIEYGLADGEVYRFDGTTWAPFASWPAELEWFPEWDRVGGDGYFLHREGGVLWVTSDFVSWESHRLPDEVSALVDAQPFVPIVRRDGLWMLGGDAVGLPPVERPPVGLWVSADLDTWELVPAPPFENAHQKAVSLPREGLLIVGNTDSSTTDLWIGRLTR